MMPVFQNYTCDPFHPISKPCTLGNLAQFSVNATETSHVQKAVRFAALHDIRLVVKNTGHDFLGRNTAPGALSIWTHHMNGTEFLPSYRSPGYSGPALKMLAGTQAWEAYEAASSVGYRVVGGTCPSVGLAGGYTLGGGHSSLTSQHGLSADNVLEWEVVTPSGDVKTASPCKNRDLFWALTGSGGGISFGVVVSVTVKVFPEGPATGGILQFNLTQPDAHDAVSVLLSGSTRLVDSGSVLYVGVTNTSVSTIISAPQVDGPTLRNQLGYITSALNKSGIAYDLTINEDPTYFQLFSRYFGPLPNGIYPVDHLMGSRLIPRSLFSDPEKTAQLQDVTRAITHDGDWALSAVVLNATPPSVREARSHNSVLPAWRDALIHYTVYSSWDWSSDAEMRARQDRLTYDIIPTLVGLTPGSGTYANEADYREENWQDEFFGANWDRLSAIKRRLDPRGLSYTPLSPGADKWTEGLDGKLCRVGRH